MEFKKFYYEHQANPDLQIRGADGNFMQVDGLVESHYQGDMVSFSLANGETMRVTPNELVRLSDNTYVTASNLEYGDTLSTFHGPQSIKSLDSYAVDDARVFSLQTRDTYVPTEAGPMLKTAPQDLSGEIRYAGRTSDELAGLSDDVFDDTVFVRMEWSQKTTWPETGEVGNLPFREDMLAQNPSRGPRYSTFSLDQLNRDGFFDMRPNQKETYLSSFGLQQRGQRELIYFQLESGTTIENYRGFHQTYYNIIVDDQTPAVKVLDRR